MTESGFEITCTDPLPQEHFRATGALPVSIEGKDYDVLSFNAQAAQGFLDKAGLPQRLECLVPGRTDAVLWPEVLQAQWKAHIGVDLRDGYRSGWNDSRYNWTLARARAESDPELRMARLGECERLLLRAMPIIRWGHDVQPQLRKPYLRGLASNLLNREQFKYVWIDTKWKPS